MGKNNDTPVKFIETTTGNLETVQNNPDNAGAFIHVNDDNGDDFLYIGDDQITDKLNMGDDYNNLDGETIQVGNFKPQNYGQLKDMTVSEILREMFRPIGVQSISLNKTSVSLKAGESTTLTATVSPSTATNKTVTWSSSNTNLVTVNTSGKVTVKSNITAGGNVIITAKAGGKSATCTVTVIPTEPTVSSSNGVTISYSGNTLLPYGSSFPAISSTIVDGSWSDGTPYAGGHGDIVMNVNPDSWGDEGVFSISGSVDFTEGGIPNDNFGNPYPDKQYHGGTKTSNIITVTVVKPIKINDGNDITVMVDHIINYFTNQIINVTIPAEVETPEPVKFKVQVPEEFTTFTVMQFNPLTQAFDISVPMVFVPGDEPMYEREDNSYTNTLSTTYQINLKK